MNEKSEELANKPKTKSVKKASSEDEIEASIKSAGFNLKK